MRKNPVLRPFLKWAGGKRQLLPEIIKHIPDRVLKKGTYYEPFLGAGAVFFALQPKRAVVSDTNSELINCYIAIRDSLEDLINKLGEHQKQYQNCSHYKLQEEYYYDTRKLDRTKKYLSLSSVEKAARIIYLNKTCYNGLFRVNSQGQFNVPFGRYKNPNILDEAVLRAVNKYLNSNDKISLLNKDFEIALKDAKKGDFIYLDPPYDPVSDTASFTGYDVNGFDRGDQKRLKKVFDDLTERGCYVMMSNSSTQFVHELYENYKDFFKIIPANRIINSKAKKRGAIDEVLVLNYEVNNC
ncbi:DNA adenine methylase [Oxynema sp. CENA135]|uniref:DNA adenine methylase n=1 Tax=Oxynema sp. CENA135 TaxID=984206 RepID=UPI00190DDDF5|nr:DNA adenine methylase [Oxynema sp. CENA135]MBK4729234.1 DNA adenine methylase [Oxynema sp. CENA135]